MNIFVKLKEELSDFYDNKIQVAQRKKNLDQKSILSREGTNEDDFSQWETVNRIDLYLNSQFESGSRDRENLKKVFLNITNYRRDVALKMIDLDVKDFLFIPTGSQEWAVWLLEREFKVWSKENGFGSLLNKLLYDFVTYGTCVAKKVGGSLERVPIRSLIVPQDAESLEKADYVIEEHEYTPTQLRKVAEEKGWDISKVEFGEDEKIKVYERYGEVSADHFGGDPGEFVEAFMIVTFLPSKDNKTKGVILSKFQSASRPYRESHWDKLDGRWLGLGVPESLFENQESQNELANFRRRAVLWSSKKILQTSDDGIARNALKSLPDGEIVRTTPNGQITQVDLSTRSLAEFSNDEQVWEQNADRKAFTFDVATGESLPSGTPFRLGAILSQVVRSFFDLKRENFGMFIKKALIELVIPEFKRKKIDGILTLFGGDMGLEKFRDFLVEIYTHQAVKENLPREGPLPDLETIQQRVRAEIDNRQYLRVDIPKEVYKDLEYKLDISVTGEEVDTQTQLETYKTALQIIASNPTVLQDPNTRKLLEKTISLTGQNFSAIIPSTQTPQVQEGGTGSPPKAPAATFQVPTPQP